MAAKPLPDQATLLKLLRYEPETGQLFWRERTPEMFSECGRGGRLGQCARWNGRFNGKIAGSLHADGYLSLRICNGPSLLAHRVVWAMQTGQWPRDQIDHINGDRLNNRICNLREADALLNGRNQCLHSTNTSGCNGVYFDAGVSKWSAQIIVAGRRKYLGAFSTKDQAIEARKRADALYGFDLGHGKRPPKKETT